MELGERRIAKMSECGIPPRMQGGIIRYYENGIPPGDFLTAVINNDLKEALGRADDENKHILFEYVLWFYNNAPMGSWGRANAMEDYVNAFHKDKK